MIRVLLIVTISVLVPLAGADRKPARKAKAAPAAKMSTYTGCIDQRGPDYVLTGDRDLKAVAILHGDGFNDDNFAREVGNKVTVEGTLAGDADPKTIRVKKVTRVAEGCEPH